VRRIESMTKMRCLLIILVFVPVFAPADDLDLAIKNEMQREGVPGLTFAVVGTRKLSGLARTDSVTSNGTRPRLTIPDSRSLA
jgi:hypothetical protein